MESDRAKTGRYRKKKRCHGFDCVTDHTHTDDLPDHDYGIPDISNVALDIYAEDGKGEKDGGWWSWASLQKGSNTVASVISNCFCMTVCMQNRPAWLRC